MLKSFLIFSITFSLLLISSTDFPVYSTPSKFLTDTLDKKKNIKKKRSDHVTNKASGNYTPVDSGEFTPVLTVRKKTKKISTSVVPLE